MKLKDLLPEGAISSPKELAQQFIAQVDADEDTYPGDTLENFFRQHFGNYAGASDEQEFFTSVIELDPGYLSPSDIADVTGRDDEFFGELADRDIQGNPKYKGWNQYVQNKKYDRLEFGRTDI